LKSSWGEKNRVNMASVNLSELLVFILRRYPALGLREILTEMNILNLMSLIDCDMRLTEKIKEITDFFSD